MTTTCLTCCPSCGFEGHIPDRYRGKRLKCRRCGTTFPAAVEQVARWEPELPLEEAAAQVLLGDVIRPDQARRGTRPRPDDEILDGAVGPLIAPRSNPALGRNPRRAIAAAAIDSGK